MIPEITIKISFTPAPGGGMEPTVASLDISPPELPEGAAIAQVPPVPEVPYDPLSSFAYEVPPPPAAMTGEDDIPPLPNTDRGEEKPFEEEREPPPPPTKGSRGSKTK